MPENSKERIDTLLVKRGLATTREKAKSILMAGLVFIENNRIDKAGTIVSVDSPIEVKGTGNPFVSRGGLKLEKAIREFNLPVEDRVFMDVGASTGGFTHCLLSHGAKAVYSIDVGYGQLAWELRQDKRVIVMERTNIRNVRKIDLDDQISGCVIDVSFISLKLVLPVVWEILINGSHVVTLIKPQFEAGRGRVGKKGVVREAPLHIEILNDVVMFSQNLGFKITNLDFSPITGPEGNIEFLCHLYKGQDSQVDLDIPSKVDRVVYEAHQSLKGR